MTGSPFPFKKVYGAALALALVTLGGLLFALLGDGPWDAISWLLLAVPLSVIAMFIAKSFRAKKIQGPTLAR